MPPGDLAAIMPHLSQVSLAVEQVLHERGGCMENLFFLEEGVASLTADTLDGGQVEVGLTGRDSFVGSSVLLNPEPTIVHRAFIQVAGSGYRVNGATFRELLDGSPALRQHCFRYIDLLLVHTGQLAACNVRHTLPERLARWLLMVRDRTDSDDLFLRHEFLSMMLGVRRAGVSVAANTLQAGGLISQSRGHITIVDHEGLASAACDCYRLLQESRAAIFRQ
jgi:CRP-like cAMP-binding protein